MTAFPCQVPPPNHAVPSSWSRCTTSRVRSSEFVEPDEDLVEHDLVEDLDARIEGKLVGEPARQRAASLDELDDPGSAQRAQRRVDGEAARAAGELRDEVAGIAVVRPC